MKLLPWIVFFSLSFLQAEEVIQIKINGEWSVVGNNLVLTISNDFSSDILIENPEGRIPSVRYKSRGEKDIIPYQDDGYSPPSSLSADLALEATVISKNEFLWVYKNQGKEKLKNFWTIKIPEKTQKDLNENLDAVLVMDISGYHAVKKSNKVELTEAKFSLVMKRVVDIKDK